MAVFRDVTARGKTRICFSYSLTPRLPVSTPGRCISETHDFGRLEDHVKAGGDLLPRVVFCHEFPPSAVSGDDRRPLALVQYVNSLRIFVTTTSRGGAVLVIDGELEQANGVDELTELLAATCSIVTTS